MKNFIAEIVPFIAKDKAKVVVDFVAAEQFNILVGNLNKEIANIRKEVISISAIATKGDVNSSSANEHSKGIIKRLSEISDVSNLALKAGSEVSLELVKVAELFKGLSVLVNNSLKGIAEISAQNEGFKNDSLILEDTLIKLTIKHMALENNYTSFYDSLLGIKKESSIQKDLITALKANSELAVKTGGDVLLAQEGLSLKVAMLSAEIVKDTPLKVDSTGFTVLELSPKAVDWIGDGSPSDLKHFYSYKIVENLVYLFINISGQVSGKNISEVIIDLPLNLPNPLDWGINFGQVGHNSNLTIYSSINKGVASGISFLKKLNSGWKLVVKCDPCAAVGVIGHVIYPI